MDEVCDTYNAIHGCQIANEAETSIGIRRAFLFNKLHEAAMNKECGGDKVEVFEINTDSEMESVIEVESGSVIEIESDSVIEVRSGSVGREPPTPPFGLEVEKPKKAWRTQPAHKWTWGADLTDEDLAQLVRGADPRYNKDLLSEGLRSMTSEGPNADALEDPEYEDLHFDELSGSMEIPELHVPEPIFSFVPLDPFGNPIADSESDSIINAFAKKKKVDATKAAKLIMQDEVDRPESFGDFGSDFNP
jgi:hypothetical protein